MYKRSIGVPPFGRDAARSALQKLGLYRPARLTYRIIHRYSGLFSLRHDDVMRIKNNFALLKPKSVFGFQKIRVGAEYDGGYVMLDDFAKISKALSFGIGNDVTWDLSIAERGIPVFQFDYTINSPPTHHKLCKFSKLKIVASEPSNATEISISDILRKCKIESDDDLLLKIDIEGAEWEIFSAVDDAILRQFRQIICEFHDFYRIGHALWRRRAFHVFEKLTKTHCVVHVHANNYDAMINVRGVTIPEVLEMTFVRRKDYQICNSREEFPTELDRPNDPNAPDIVLGNFTFN